MFLKVVFRQNLPVNKKLEDFWTLPISALFALKRAYLMTDLPGNNWELFEHIRFEILGKAKDEYKKKLIEFYVKEMRDTPLTKNRKKLA